MSTLTHKTAVVIIPCFEVSEISLIWRNDPPDDQFRVASVLPLKPGRR